MNKFDYKYFEKLIEQSYGTPRELIIGGKRISSIWRIGKRPLDYD